MDDIIAATGMSASAVYRYFRSKDEIIDATAEEGLRRVGDMFIRMLAEEPSPDPGQVLKAIADRFSELAGDPRQDMSRIAMQTWAEALRRPQLHDHARRLYNQALDHLTELASRWVEDGHLSPGADPRAAATTVFTLMQGMIVFHHFVDDLDPDALLRGTDALGGGRPEPARSAAPRIAPSFREAAAG
jgi:AcrR family transcriptional regulator